MKPENTAARRIMKLKFAGLYFISLVLIVLVLSAFWGPLPANNIKAIEPPPLVNTAIPQKHLMQADKMLHLRLLQLQQLDEDRALMLTNSKISESDEINKAIVATETMLKKSIDSLSEASADLDKEGKDLRNEIIAFFNMALKNRRSVGVIEKVLSTKGNTTAVDGQALVRLQNEVESKKNRIAELERTIKSRQDLSTDNTPKTPEKIKDENNFLKWAVRSQVSQIRTLTDKNTSLRMTNENLTNQVNELKRNR